MTKCGSEVEARVPPQKILEAPLSAQLGIDETSSDALNEKDAEIEFRRTLPRPGKPADKAKFARSSVARPLGSEAATPAAAAHRRGVGEGLLAAGARDEGQAKAVIAQLAESSVDAEKSSRLAGKTGRDDEVGDSSVCQSRRSTGSND